MTHDSTRDTLTHIDRVRSLLLEVLTQLTTRAVEHDSSKLGPAEKPLFDKYTPVLRTLTYNSPEYHQALMDLAPALDHHYGKNRHHPQHFLNGVDGMTLIDVVEMLADWKAATERTAEGDLRKSLDVNRSRFKLSDQLYGILVNTAEALGWFKPLV